ncbi:MAG: hypothetical protein ACM37Z_00485 [Deltaproteobacteria bacterium]|jgi:hypothetical protein
MIAVIVIGLTACGGGKEEQQAASGDGPTAIKEAAISGTVTLDPGIKDKVGKEPLLMIMASTSSEPTKPALVVKRIADASFPYDYKLTAEDITLVGSSFSGKMYVTARIDSAGMVGPPRPGTFEGVYSANPVPVGSTKIDIVINKAY